MLELAKSTERTIPPSLADEPPMSARAQERPRGVYEATLTFDGMRTLVAVDESGRLIEVHHVAEESYDPELCDEMRRRLAAHNHRLKLKTG